MVLMLIFRRPIATKLTLPLRNPFQRPSLLLRYLNELCNTGLLLNFLLLVHQLEHPLAYQDEEIARDYQDVAHEGERSWHGLHACEVEQES